MSVPEDLPMSALKKVDIPVQLQDVLVLESCFLEMPQMALSHEHDLFGLESLGEELDLQLG